MHFEIIHGRLVIYGQREEQVRDRGQTIPASKAVTRVAFRHHERVAKSVDRRVASASFPEERGKSVLDWLSNLGFRLSPSHGLYTWHRENVEFTRRKRGSRTNHQR